MQRLFLTIKKFFGINNQFHNQRKELKSTIKVLDLFSDKIR